MKKLTAKNSKPLKLPTEEKQFKLWLIKATTNDNYKDMQNLGKKFD